MLDKLVLQKFGAVCGFVVPIVAFGCIGIAILSYPEFSWANNALSDLGIVSGITASVFNLGLFIAGLLCFFFASMGLFSYFKSSVVGKLGVIFFAMAAVWLMAIGVFNMDFWPAHFIVAVSFFVTLPVALLILTAALYLHRAVNLVVFTLCSSVVAAIPWVLYLIMPYVPNVAIPEIISSLVGSIWIVTISYKILKNAKT